VDRFFGRSIHGIVDSSQDRFIAGSIHLNADSSQDRFIAAWLIADWKNAKSTSQDQFIARLTHRMINLSQFWFIVSQGRFIVSSTHRRLNLSQLDSLWVAGPIHRRVDLLIHRRVEFSQDWSFAKLTHRRINLSQHVVSYYKENSTHCSVDSK
jgi:hypothetical protein